MEYMSKERYEQLAAEIEEIVKVELPKAKDELSEARAKGDLSENFEYHAAKRALRRVMSQIRFKTNVLQHSQKACGVSFSYTYSLSYSFL